MIRISELNKYFNKGKQNEIHVINDISLELPETGMVAFFGQSGCGKTTLLNTLGGLDKFQSGCITMDEQQMSPNNDLLRNSHIGFIFQNYNLFNDRTVYDNVSDSLRLCGMTDEEEIGRRVKIALRNVGMENFVNRTPDTLSAGQQQRVAIARAVVKNPKVLLADEPTGNLDEGNTVAVMDLLKGISKNHLVILVTHEAELVDYYCDKVIGLSDGKIVNVRENNTEEGFVAKNKNVVYLGDLEKTSEVSGNLQVDFFGEAPEEPLKLTVVRENGTWYLRVDTEKVRLVNATSEIELREGTFTEEVEAKKENIAFTELPDVQGRRFGNLFRFRQSVKSGFAAYYSKRHRKRERALKLLLFVISVVLVFVTAANATPLKTLDDLRNSYNDHVFYVPIVAGDYEVGDTLRKALDDPDSGIVFEVIQAASGYKDNLSLSTVSINPYVFPSYQGSYFSTVSYNTEATTLPASLLSDARVVCGSTELTDKGAVVTTAFLDELIKGSGIGYLKEYEDFLGFKVQFSTNYSYGNVSRVIVGVVANSERNIYVKDSQIAEISLSRTELSIAKGSAWDKKVSDGTVLILKKSSEVANITDSSMKIHGTELKVAGQETVGSESEGYYGSLSKEEYEKRMILFAEKQYDIEVSDLDELKDTMQSVYGIDWSDFRTWFEEELYYEGIYANDNPLGREDYLFLVSDADYEKIASFYGENSELLKTDAGTNVSIGNERNGIAWIMIYSEQPGKTENYLNRILKGNKEKLMKVFSTSEDGEDYDYYVKNYHIGHDYVSPSNLYSDGVKTSWSDIREGLLFVAIFLGIICIVLFFTMRANMMNRIREIGIYRAIGVSKRNLWFRFFVESLVLTVPTVYLGFFVAGGAIKWMTARSNMIDRYLYFHNWLAIVLLVVIFVVTSLSSILPVMLLTRKTPSEIIAKYDI